MTADVCPKGFDSFHAYYSARDRSFCLYLTIVIISFSALALSPIAISEVRGQQVGELFVEPSEIEIVKSSNDLSFEDRTIILGNTGMDITNASIFLGDLSENEQGRWIPKSSLLITPKESFNLGTGNFRDLTLTFNVTRLEPGTYSGRLWVIGNGFDSIPVPITVKVHDNLMIAFFLIGLGVVVNFTLKFMKMKVGEEQIAREAIKNAERILSEIPRERQQDDSFKRGNSLLEKAKTSLNLKGDPIQAKDEAQQAMELVARSIANLSEAKAKSEVTAEGELDVLPQKEPPQPFSSDMPPLVQSVEVNSVPLKSNIPIEVGVRSSFARLKRRNYLVYAIISVILAISVLQVWQLYFPTVGAFGASPFDYLTAFLFGFATEALLGEAIEFTKRN